FALGVAMLPLCLRDAAEECRYVVELCGKAGYRVVELACFRDVAGIERGIFAGLRSAWSNRSHDFLFCLVRNSRKASAAIQRAEVVPCCRTRSAHSIAAGSSVALRLPMPRSAQLTALRTKLRLSKAYFSISGRNGRKVSSGAFLSWTAMPAMAAKAA